MVFQGYLSGETSYLYDGCGGRVTQNCSKRKKLLSTAHAGRRTAAGAIGEAVSDVSVAIDSYKATAKVGWIIGVAGSGRPSAVAVWLVRHAGTFEGWCANSIVESPVQTRNLCTPRLEHVIDRPLVRHLSALAMCGHVQVTALELRQTGQQQ
jgi:hypothetical protein